MPHPPKLYGFAKDSQLDKWIPLVLFSPVHRKEKAKFLNFDKIEKGISNNVIQKLELYQEHTSSL